MKKQKFSETQIASVIKQYEGGHEPMELSREYGISKATLFNWPKKYSGMDSTHIEELKALQDENRRLNQMSADLTLDHQFANDIIEKKVVKPCYKSELAGQVKSERSVSVGRACRVINLQRPLWYYRDRKNDSAIIQKLTDLAEQFRIRGFDKYFSVIRLHGLKWARSRVLRLYRQCD